MRSASVIRRLFTLAPCLAALLCFANASFAQSTRPAIYDVRTFDAKGDGKTLDTPAINSALEAVSKAGGGTLHFPAGIYPCFSIHLQSNVVLYLDRGAVILAAGPTLGGFP